MIYRVIPAILLLIFGFSNLALATESCQGGPSLGFKLKGAIYRPKNITPAKLQQYQASKLTVSYYTGKSGLVTQTYLGVPLYDLIQEAGVIVDPARKNDILRKYLVIDASDCYEAVVAVPEILPTFGGQQVLVAYATVDVNGNPVPLADAEGAIRLVVPGDKAGGRYVSNVTRITVKSAP